MVTMDWRLMEKVVNVLKNFNSATEQLSGSSNCIIEAMHRRYIVSARCLTATNISSSFDSCMWFLLAMFSMGKNLMTMSHLQT